MKITISILTLSISLVTLPVFSQNKEDIKDINTQIWANFTKAFESFDYELFGNIHSEDLIRVGGDYKSVRDKSNYIAGYKKRWERKQIPQTISFRFLERIAKDGKASERGIYKLTRNPNTDQAKSFYGKFHVILRKEKGIWKILVDYDSSENNTINEASYLEAFRY